MKKAQITLVLGSDMGAVMEETSCVCTKLLGTKNEWNYVEYDGETAEIDEILGDLVTPPFLGDMRVIVVKRVTAFSNLELTKLVDSLKDMPESVYVILTATSIDRRGKFYRQIKDMANLVDLDSTNGDFVEKINRRASELGLVNLPEAVIQLLAQRSGGNLSWVDNELAKLSAYQLSAQEPLTLELANRIVSVGFEAVDDMAGFELLRLIGAGDTARSVKVLHQLLETGQSALALLGLLAWQYRMVVAAASLQALGIPAAQVSRKVAQALNMKPTPVKKAVTTASKLGYVKAVKAFQLIFQTGYKARLGVYSFEHALELLVIKLSRLSIC